MKKTIFLFLFLLLGSGGCIQIDAVKTNAHGNMNCIYNDEIDFFHGQITLEGIGLDRFEPYLVGSWALCNTKTTARCEIRIDEVKPPEQPALILEENDEYMIVKIDKRRTLEK